jgi:CubicO group peptidase (beta-lactamase class C family)
VGRHHGKFNLPSIRKSFLSALYGVHVRQGRIRLDKTLEQLGIVDNPPSLTVAEKNVTVRDLLKSRSGVYHATVMDMYFTPAKMAARPARGSHALDAFWYYNVWDADALGTIFEQETKTRIFEELKRRVADPLGVEDYRVEDGQYRTGRESIHPACNFRMTARDMARFGLLFLRQGKWRGTAVVSEDWVRESTQSYSETPSGVGCG